MDPRRDRGDLKKLILLREREEWWRGLGLTPTQLAELGGYLDGTLTSAPCNHMLCHTRAWLAQSGLAGADQIIQAIKDRGGHCDCEVLSNVTLRTSSSDPVCSLQLVETRLSDSVSALFEREPTRRGVSFRFDDESHRYRIEHQGGKLSVVAHASLQP